MAVVEESFPRGRKAFVEKKNQPVSEKRRKNDGLFNISGKKKPKKSMQKKKFIKNMKKKKQAEVSLTKKEKKKIEKENTMLDVIEPFSFKMITEGLRVLARIQEVREIDLLLNLPGRIQAVVPISNISTPYTNLLNKMAQDEGIDVKGLKEMLKEGDVFPCCIKEVTNDGSFKVTASLNPADVNSDLPTTALSKGLKITAAVQSVEDHGFVMDIGLSNARCFLPKTPDLQLDVGQIVSVCVTNCQTEGHVATLTVSTSETVKIKQNEELNVSTLMPGTKIHVNVSKVYPQGLTVTFGNLVGYIHRDHLIDSTDLSAQYVKGANYTAVVLYTVPLVNAVYLSLKSSLSRVKPTEKEVIEIGKIIDGTVLEATAAGLFLQLLPKVKGFVPLRHLSDNRDIFEEIKSLFPVKARKRCRILSYATLDEVYICTMKKSLLEQKKLRYEDFSIGEIIEAKIDSLTPAGISLNLGPNLKGFIPKLHWADDPRLKKPELRFRPGQTISCRVLKVMVDRKNVHLTCKKSLIDIKTQAHSDPTELQKGQSLKGTVTLIESGGVLVTFFGDLSGWMPRQWLEKKGISDMSRFFYLGQVVDCTVHSIQESGKVMLNLAKEDNAKTEKHDSKPVQNLGTIVKCRVEKIFKEGQDGSCGLEVSIPSLNANGFIPVEHLSDFPRMAPHLLQCYKTGDVIEDAVVWHGSKLQTVLTLKPTIVDFAKANNFPASVDEIGVNSIFPLVSTHHKTFGVFASLLCPPQSCEVLFPHSKLPSEIFSALEKDVRYLTMEGKTIKIDQETKKIFVELNSATPTDKGVLLLKNYLQEQERLQKFLMKSSDERLKSLASMKLGDVVVGKLSMEFDPTADLEFDLPHGVKGIVPAYHHAEKNFKKNDLIVGSVLYSDLVRQVAFVTTRTDIINRITANNNTSNTTQPKGTQPNSKVILNTDYFSLVSVVDGAVKNVAFVSNLRNINQVLNPLAPPYRVGFKVNVVGDPLEHGNIATYQKTPKSWMSVRTTKRRAAATDDEPKNKKSKKEVKAAVNGKKSDADANDVQPPRKKKAQQVPVPNDATVKGGDVKAAEPSSVEVNKSSTKKAIKGWEVTPVNGVANEDTSTKNAATKSKNTKNQTKKASNEKEMESNAKGVESVDKTADNKKTTTKRKDQDRVNLAPNSSTPASDDLKDKPVENGGTIKDLSPSKKRKVDTVKSKTATKPLDLPRLSIATAFKWDDDMTGLPLSSTAIPSDSSDSEEENAEEGKVVVKDRRERARQKLEQAKLEEARLSKIEDDLNNPERAPTTADDFDRMVLASPNSSILWLQYMAFHLENAEIERARTVAQRALKIISFREEQEKFNVWIALLNLEHMYGTTESYENTLKEALCYNEPFKVHRQMALNFEQNNKFEEAEALYTTMMKKYKQNKSVYINTCLFYVRNSKLDTARGVFQRALSILDKKEHIDLISRFAQLEMKFGQLERGKTLFDTMMMSYPKRTDLWLVYIDTLTKVGDIESARQVLERCITLQLPAKKMKTVFQKFLEFETHHGDAERQNYVRKKALDYVESKTEAVDD